MFKNKNKIVLHMIAGLGNGGAERQLVELLKINRRHVLCIFTHAGTYKTLLQQYNIKYYELHINRPYFIFLKIITIVRIIKLTKAEVIHSWMYNACLISSIIKILFRIRIPLVWGIRCSNMIVKHYPFQLRIVIYLCKIFSKKSNLIIYNSFAGKKYHDKLGFFNLKSKVIQNGINNKKFYFSSKFRTSLRNKYNFKNKDLVILCVGRLDPMKNHQALIKAYENIRTKFKKLKLVLIGKDTETIIGTPEVIKLGMKANIEKYYSMGDIIILPSAFGEGFSNSLVEGMVSNLFPISTNVGDARLIIDKTGLIIRQPSIVEIQKTLVKVAGMKNKIIKILAEKGSLRVKYKFNLENMGKKYMKIYREIK